MHDVENCACETSPSVWYFLESEPLESQQGNRSSYKINCQNFNKPPPCIINAGYSRASLRILVPYDTMWLNMKPLPQPAAPSHNSTAQSASVVKIKIVQVFIVSREASLHMKSGFAHTQYCYSQTKSGDKGEDTGGVKARKSLSDVPLMASLMNWTWKQTWINA